MPPISYISICGAEIMISIVGGRGGSGWGGTGGHGADEPSANYFIAITILII